MRKILKYCIFVIIIMQLSEIVAHMQPLKKEGAYYYSVDDTHKHIDLKRALSFLASRIFSPTKWIKGIASLFYSTEQKSNAIELLDPTQTVPELYSIEPKIIWVGHSTFLIQMNGFNILTDPIWGDVKVGPFSLTKRGMPAGIRLEDLPPIDAIVISHNHSDHLDTNALTYINKKYHPIVYVPEGNAALIKDMGIDRIIQNTWWDENTLVKDNNSITITCLPAYHWSIRFSLGSYRQALWSSWMIGSKDSNIYFAGDTAYGKHFKEIAQTFPLINIALMPIGPTDETDENSHKNSHVDAKEAIDAFIDLNAQCFVPMHYGTFFLSKNTLEYPINRLYSYWKEKENELSSKKLLFARCGEQYRVEK